MRAARVPRFVFSSTAAVYGNPTELPITESAVKAPTNTYGATKLAFDLALTSEAFAHELAAVSLRYFNVAGALIRPDGTEIGERHDPETHLIPIALQVAAGKREKLQLFGDDYPTADGTCVRDYIHVEDLARAHLLALDAATARRAPDLQPRQRQRLHQQAGGRGGPRGHRAPAAGGDRAAPRGRPGHAGRLVRAGPRRARLGAAEGRPCTTWSATPGRSTAPTSRDLIRS